RNAGGAGAAPLARDRDGRLGRAHRGTLGPGRAARRPQRLVPPGAPGRGGPRRGGGPLRRHPRPRRRFLHGRVSGGHEAPVRFGPRSRASRSLVARSWYTVAILTLESQSGLSQCVPRPGRGENGDEIRGTESFSRSRHGGTLAVATVVG